MRYNMRRLNCAPGLDTPNGVRALEGGLLCRELSSAQLRRYCALLNIHANENVVVPFAAPAADAAHSQDDDEKPI